MYRFIFLFLFSTNIFADGLKHDPSFDLGIGVSPSFSSEGYDNAKINLGVEFGASFYRYTKSPKTNFKLLRVGIGVVGNKPVVLFSPISVYLKEYIYFSPTIGFGKDPHTVFSISYDLVE